MNHIKIDYGIDLGTTNSAICRMEKGEARIIKSDASSEIMPSCVQFSSKAVRVGDIAFSKLNSDRERATRKWQPFAQNIFVKFKRGMGTDTKHFPEIFNGEKFFTPEELSSEVLKTLKSFVLDDDVRSVVITVPAKFNQNAKDATMRAAMLAGFSQCELLQEPIAASMAYGLSSVEKNGLWMVFDFGGGTFDAALVKSEDGMITVADTDGDNYLGGTDLDMAIVDYLLIPYLQETSSINKILADKHKREILREALAVKAEEAKNQLSFRPSWNVISDLGEYGYDDDDNEIELDLTITQDQLKPVLAPIFQKAVDICQQVLKRNNLSGKDLSKLILVGGPTHSPIIRQMLREQITEDIDTSMDPMTVVATGAALYASTIDSKVSNVNSKDVIELNIKYEATSIQTEEWVSIKLKSPYVEPVYVELSRSSDGWKSARHELTLQGDVIEVQLREGRPNLFDVMVYDQTGNEIMCSPNEFTIIQGTMVNNAPLSFSVGVEAWDEDSNIGIFQVFKGLEKNTPLPATGKIERPLKTSIDLRPGCATDVLKIPIYEADPDKEVLKERAAYFNLTYTVVITGEYIPQFVPAFSDVELTFKCEDKGWRLFVYIPVIDYTFEYPISTGTTQSATDDYLEEELSKVRSFLSKLKSEGFDVEEEEKELSEVEHEFENSSEKVKILEQIRKLLRKLDKHDNNSDWQRTEKKLRSAFIQLEKSGQKYGDDKSKEAILQIRKQVDDVIRIKNSTIAKSTIRIIEELEFKIARIEHYTSRIKWWDAHFDEIKWSNIPRARHLVSQAINLLNTTHTNEQLELIHDQIYNMLPYADRPKGADGLLTTI